MLEGVVVLKEIPITEVGGFRVGHAQDTEAGTGCTVVLCDAMSPAGADIRGGGPASRESRILDPCMAAEGVNAVLLSGGSAFGLDAAGGVQRYLEERGIGLDTGFSVVPLVPQSCLFDLGVGRADIRPDAAMAYAACENASYEAPAMGNVGAGAGCTVGKCRGPDRAMKSGFGAYAVETNGVRVGAMVAVNAFGDVYDADGTMLAGLRTPDGTALSCSLTEIMQDAAAPDGAFCANTTLGIVVTNCRFSKSELTKIAGMTHNGYARAIRPVHTSVDGDSIYALSTGSADGSLDRVGVLAAHAMERAIVRAVKSARSAYGFPGLAGR